MRGVLLLFTLFGLAGAQTPAGSIAGVVCDPSGATVAGVTVNVVSLATGMERTVATTAQGNYSFAALQAGEYEVSAETSGFRRTVLPALVEAGVTTTADIVLQVGEASESVTVDAAWPQMHYDSHSVGGVVTSSQIESLPLNGRGFLDLAKLEPGVQAPSRGSNNRAFVPILGTPRGRNGRATRVTIDGGSIMAIGNGGSAMGLSQEVVQEFQTSTVNFDLATGLTYGGAINVVSRSGSNDVHGTAFYFFRDHTLEAYPALNRDPKNPDPFFQRRQFGFALGGPIRRDRAFFFANWERNEQRGLFNTTLIAPDFAHFSRITPTPSFGNQLSVRLDGRFSKTHLAFLRYSHDGSRAFGLTTLTGAGRNAYPSSWTRQPVWADQTSFGLTSVFRPAVVNDLRLSYFFISSKEVPPTEEDCRGCLGVGAPAVNVAQAGLFIGESAFSYNLGRRFHFNDILSWQRGTHRARFGIDWEHNRGGRLEWFNEPVTMTLFSPDQVRLYNAQPQTLASLRIPLPSVFHTLNDILQLPLQSTTLAIGDPRVPQENGGTTRRWNTARLFFHDAWRVRQGLTVNYGLGWSIDRNLNYDLTKPALLTPILGPGGLGATQKQWKNFSPVLGLAWAPSSDGKMVIRAGAGIFYDFLFPPNLDLERAVLGPPGLGRQTFNGSSIANTLAGIPGVPPGTPLDFRGAPTLFTGADLMTILPSIRASLAEQLDIADPSVRAIQISKQVSGQLGALFPDVPSPSALHTNVGIQREIARHFVVNVDFVYRHFLHFGLGPAGVDLNHYSSIRGPIIPVCTAAQRNDPEAICSLGPFNVWEAAARATYKGILLRADKRFSHGFQVLGSYAYSRNDGTNIGNGFNLDDWLESYGPLSTDYTHIANLAGVASLLWRFELGVNFSYSSVAPFSAVVGGIDFNGDGTVNDLLPGTTVNGFNRGLGRSDLVRWVDQFNQIYVGKRDSHGRSIPLLTLPEHYSFSDNLHSLDLRVTRPFALSERCRLLLIGEVFNLYNAANLSGFAPDLTSAAFGQPTSRLTQVFGSGGPRAFQVALRLNF